MSSSFRFVCIVHVPAVGISVLCVLLQGQCAQQPLFCRKAQDRYEEGKGEQAVLKNCKLKVTLNIPLRLIKQKKY